jgi:hypothetical protein
VVRGAVSGTAGRLAATLLQQQVQFGVLDRAAPLGSVVAAGVLSLDQIREGAPDACTLLPGGNSLAPVQSAPVPPPERPGEAAEGSPSTETWEFRAIVAEAVTAALVKAMPRIIVAAVTGHTS